MYCQMNGQTKEGYTDGNMDRQKERQTNKSLNALTDLWTDK
jgi:hypothetical protein